jgi:methionine synthase II (cobalamin-independent)
MSREPNKGEKTMNYIQIAMDAYNKAQKADTKNTITTKHDMTYSEYKTKKFNEVQAERVAHNIAQGRAEAAHKARCKELGYSENLPYLELMDKQHDAYLDYIAENGI